MTGPTPKLVLVLHRCGVSWADEVPWLQGNTLVPPTLEETLPPVLVFPSVNKNKFPFSPGAGL